MNFYAVWNRRKGALDCENVNSDRTFPLPCVMCPALYIHIWAQNDVNLTFCFKDLFIHVFIVVRN